jgi:hypothetical protein
MIIKKHKYQLPFLEIANLVVSFATLYFYISIETWWPLVSDKAGNSLPFLILTILGFLFSLYFTRSKKLQLAKKIMLYIAQVIWFVGGMFILLTILVVMAEKTALPQRYEQLAQIETAGKKYLLVYHSGGCLDCGRSLQVYRCELFNLICPPFGEGPYAAESLPYTLSKLTIEISLDQKRVNMLEDGKVVYVFGP